MSIFQNLSTTGLEEQTDSLGGFQLLESNVYPAKVKTVYITTSKNNAMAANVVLDIDGREYREQLWITNSKGENFFVNKSSGNRVALPGFAVLNDLCLCTVGKELEFLETDQRTFKIYDYETKSDMLKEVPTITDLMDTEILVAITKKREFKKIKDASGAYVNSNETRELNTIKKIFHAGTKMTVTEAKAGKKEGEFLDKWLAKNQGKIEDATKKSSAGIAGAPQKPQAAAKPVTKSLFS